MPRYLKWDGRCFTDVLTADPKDWCNKDVTPAPPPSSRPGVLVTTLGSDPQSGVTASSLRAEVCLIAVDEAFAPIEEWLTIQLEFKQIEKAGCLVLQIHDADNKLVYAERLTKEQIGGLPEYSTGFPPAPLAAGSSKPDKPKRDARRALRWAHPAASPYRATLWISNKPCASNTSTAEIPIDVSAPSKNGGDYVEKNSVKTAVIVVTPPFPEADQTTVRFDGDFVVEPMPWDELWEEITGEDKFPVEHSDVAGLADRGKQVAWVKARLNQLGFYAGPVNTDEANQDFLKAVRRYGSMRAVDGKRPYKKNEDGQPGLPDYDEKNKVLESPTTKFDNLAGLEPHGYPLASLIEHLKREKKLAKQLALEVDTTKTLCASWTGDPVKLVLEGNRYYMMDLETEQILKHKAEAAWLSRPHIPLRVRVAVRKRFSLERIYVPEVLRDVRFSWTWADSEEDLKKLPDPDAPELGEASDFAYDGESREVYKDAKNRSRVRAYIKAAKADIVKKLAGTHNAREPVGGVLTSDWDTHDYHCVFAGRDPASFETDSSLHKVMSVGPLIYFKPSTIAGDIYQLKAAFEPAQQKTAGGVAISSDRQDKLGKLNKLDKLEAKTRTIIGWRRLRVAAFVPWPEQEGKPRWDGKTFRLDDVVKGMQKELAFAYIEIVPSQPGAKTLRTVKPGAIKLEGSDIASKNPPVPPATFSTYTLKNNGVVIRFPSIEECVQDFLDTAAVDQRMGRGMYAPTGGSAELDKFSEAAVLPRLAVRNLVVDTTNHMDDLPANGVLPSISRICQFLLKLKLDNLLKSAKTSFHSASITNLAEPQAAFYDMWTLVQDWASTPQIGANPAQKALVTELRKAGAWYVAELGKLVRVAPVAAGPPAPVRSVKPTKDTSYFVWHDATVPATPLQYVEAAVHAYPQEEFPFLMNLMLLPPGGARGELELWAKGGALPGGKAPRAASIYNLLANIAHTQPPVENPNYLVYDAIQFYKTWLGSILVCVAQGKKYCETGELKGDAPKKVDLYAKAPFTVECMLLETAIGGSMTNLGNIWAIPFDEVLRKGLGCRRDGDGDYLDFADGMIIVNALVNQSVKVAGTEYKVAGTSVGSPLGLVFVCQTTAMEPYALFAHELAHVLFMDHFQNAKGLIFDHDHSDANCAMSYPLIEIKDAEKLATLTEAQKVILDNVKSNYAAKWSEAYAALSEDRDTARRKRLDIGNIGPHVLSKVYRPHFCGKCNLKLRGWNLYAEHSSADLLIRQSSTEFPDKPPFMAVASTPPVVAKRVGPATVKLVRGGADSGASGEAAVASIPVSWFPSTMVTKGASPFPVSPVAKPADASALGFMMKWLLPFPTAFGHNADALSDPGTFKIEVHDPNRADPCVFVKLEALMPTYDPKGAVTSWAEFGGGERDRRSLLVECRPIEGDANRYRSRYLRLVTDEADFNGLASTRQGLLVTDMADGEGGDNDKVEILDQKVRATYDDAGSAVTAEAAVGTPGRTRKRLKLFFHLFKHPTVSAGDLEKQARLRTMKWVRRVYAQAEMAPRIVGVEQLEWPDKNMLSIQGIDYHTFSDLTPAASGVDAAAKPSKLTVTLTVKDGVAPRTVTVEALVGKDSAAPAIGAAIAKAVNEAGEKLTATALPVPPSDQAHPLSCDVLITAEPGKTVTIDTATTNDTALTGKAWVLEIATADPAELNDDDNCVGGSPPQRRILRSGKSADDRIDVYVVPAMKIAGRAYPAYCSVKNSRYHPDATIRRAAIMAYRYDNGGKSAMDGSDQTPFTLAHEIGHVLVDTGHNQAEGELMKGSACVTNRVDAPKRIFGAPLKCGYDDPNQLDSDKNIPLNDQDAYQRMMSAGAPAVTEAW